MSNLEQTLSIIKPDAVERNLVNEIKDIFTKNKLNINHGFVVSPTPSLGHQMPIGFVVSCFRGFANSISGTSNPIGFVVLWFHGFANSISGTSNPIGFMVSWFHGFVVSDTLLMKVIK